jgi:hypothetical protein
MATKRPRFEVADVVRLHGDDYCRSRRTSTAQQKVLNHIVDCRTATLGGHLDECDSCGQVRISYNSCRDRHCPKCQSLQRVIWIANRLQRLLPVPHFHIVFTIPDQLNPLALRNKSHLYEILFKTASRTLIQIARDEKHLGGQVGFTAVLHSWGQNLRFHPHLHCVVTGGGLSPDGKQWLKAPPQYLLPVKVLASLFRGKFLDHLHQAWQDGKLDLAGSTADLADPVVWSAFKDQLYRKDWIVYAKPPFGGPQQVFRYLGNYTHRVGIANHRLVGFAGGKVTFTVKDYTDHGRRKRMTLDAEEFIRRFLLHVLPERFVRVRHYGLYAGRNIRTRLAAAQKILQPNQSNSLTPLQPNDPPTPWWEIFRQLTGLDVMACPICGGHLVRKRTLGPIISTENPMARAPPMTA